MIKKQGIATSIIIAIIAGVFVLGGVAIFNMQPEEEIMMAEAEEQMREGEEMMHEGETMMEEGEEMMDKAEDMMGKESEEIMEEGFTGERLAGSEGVPLLEYNDTDYKKALESDKLVVLYFYANWCPQCRLEFPKMKKAFDGFDSENVVGFRVNFKDTQTAEAEKELAREHGVGYQHTKVLIKNGERIVKSPETWNTEKYISEIISNI